MSGTLAQTPLHDWHAAHGGRLVDFAGWSMPVQYTSIVAEHQATRTAAGLFDISHMGRLRFDGPGAAAFSIAWSRAASPIRSPGRSAMPGHQRRRRHPRRRAGLSPGRRRRRLVLADGRQRQQPRRRSSTWIEPRLAAQPNRCRHDRRHARLGHDRRARARGDRPAAAAGRAADRERSSITPATETRIAGHGGIVSRTGYTGEDGCELIVGPRAAAGIWQTSVDAGATPPDSAAATRCGSKPACRCTATS